MRRAVVTVKPDDWPVMGCLTGICTACISEEEKGYVSIFIITMVISVLFLLLFGMVCGIHPCQYPAEAAPLGEQRLYAGAFSASVRQRCDHDVSGVGSFSAQSVSDLCGRLHRCYDTGIHNRCYDGSSF